MSLRALRLQGIILTLCLFCLLLCPALQTQAADLDTAISLKSNGYYRGFELSRDDRHVAQLLADLQLENGLYLGAWASTVDFDDDRNFELDYYLGYQRRLSSALAYEITLQRYTFNEDATRGNYDWTELQLSAHIGQRTSIMYARGRDWLGRKSYSSIAEATYRHPLPSGITGFVTVGRHMAKKVLPRNFSYYEAGLVRNVGKFEMNVLFAHSQSTDLQTVHRQWSIGITRRFAVSL